MQSLKIKTDDSEFTVLVDADAFDVRGTFTVVPAEHFQAVASYIDGKPDQYGRGMDLNSVTAAGIQKAFINDGYTVEVPEGAEIQNDLDNSLEE